VWGRCGWRHFRNTPMVCGFVPGVRREFTPAERSPRNYALTLRALLELLVALELSRFKMSS